MTKNLFVICIFLTTNVLIQSVRETNFSARKICSDLCNVEIGGRSSLHCALKCSSDPNCFYWAWDSNPGLCKLCQATDGTGGNCGSNGTPMLNAYNKVVCANGGTLDIISRSCSCPAGFVGNVCQRRIYDCSEGYQLNLPSGVYKIQPSLATSPFSVYCKNVWGGRMFIAIRLEPDLLFNRTWEEYRNGFGNVAGDYWLGLQNIYLLTNSGLNYKLYVQMKDKADFFRQQIYFSFKISDETSSYRLYFNSTEPNAGPQRVLGDSLSPALGSRFSTYDADHDGDVTENCALRHQSGWWLPSPCNLTEGNPLGRLVRPSDEVWSGNSEDIFWLNDLGNKAPYKVEMWLVRL